MTSFLSPTQAPRCHTRPVEFSTWYSSVNQSLSVDCGAFFFWHGHWRRVLSAAHNYLANHSCHLRHSNIVLRPSKEIWSFFFRPSIQYFSHYFSSLRTSSSSLRAFFFDRSGFTALAHRNKEVARLSHRRVEVVIIIARHDPSWCWLARRKWKGKKKKEQKTKWENHRLVRNGGSDVEISLVSPSFPFVPPFVWRNFLSWLVRCVIVFCFADPIDVGPPPAVRRSLFFFSFPFFFLVNETGSTCGAMRGVNNAKMWREREREREKKKSPRLSNEGETDFHFNSIRLPVECQGQTGLTDPNSPLLLVQSFSLEMARRIAYWSHFRHSLHNTEPTCWIGRGKLFLRLDWDCHSSACWFIMIGFHGGSTNPGRRCVLDRLLRGHDLLRHPHLLPGSGARPVPRRRRDDLHRRNCAHHER